MRIALKRQALDRDGYILRVALPLLVVLAAMLVTRVPKPLVPTCTFKNWTGIPCGGCGTFRGLDLLARGELGAALVMQPLIIGSACLAIVYALCTLAAALFRWPRLQLIRWSARDTGWCLCFAVLGYFVNWGYLILDGR